METLNMNEIVFENRNKSYGAYALRKSYNDNIIKGLVISTLLFASFVVITNMFSKVKNIVVPKLPDPIVLNLKPEIFQMPEQPKPAEAPKPKVTPPAGPTPNNAPPVVSKIEDPNPVKPVEPIVAAAIPGPTPGPAVVDPLAGEGKKIVKEAENSATVAFKPEFFGDLIKYLSKHIRYPERASESSISGTVYISFIIDEVGNVTNVKLLRGIGGGCDEEALDVVKKMPAWKPGRNEANEPVRVMYNLPVKFTLAKS
jgi:protein TonB